MSAADPRIRRADELLRELGIPGRVQVRGHQDDIACLVVPEASRGRLVDEPGRRLAERLRTLGFRYVALDLDPGFDSDGAGGNP